ncbi:hypothetical protein TrVE_jg14297 [Triparma verrucosa]|uniref:Peptidylprolyl isomerase n=1 Tax=Triparma verrucosa TaxID=1606542 RepID=A0A9W7BZY7_9STRA|nr:hypothetical protein TrVE_jg14297 [Triparma verrucosa]
MTLHLFARILLLCAAVSKITTDAFISPASILSRSKLHLSSDFTLYSKTPTPSYPTQRGTSTDSRQIVSQTSTSAYRLRHILLASESAAEEVMTLLKNGKLLFTEVARTFSACEITRSKDGEVGWFDFSGHDVSDHPLDPILPLSIRSELAVSTSMKPGDIEMFTSDRGVHLIQLVDVMVDVSAKTKTRQRSDANTWSTAVDPSNPKKQLYYTLETMGCQMNIADSERMSGQLQNLNILPLPPTSPSSSADVVVLNTCSIRDHAEQKVYSYIGPHAKRKRSGESVSIIVAGCVAEQEGEQLLRRCPEVDLVLGPQYANRLGDLLEDVNNGNQVVATEPEFIIEDITKPKRDNKVCAWVNIIYGCNERCAFCIVPSTRGVEQSRTAESILEECKGLVQEGYKEVTLLGQNIDAYGRDLSPKRKFSDLLSMIGSIPGLERVRFVTSHPRYMSDGVVDAVADCKSVCNSFHIPFQSGSDKVLREMGRGHTRRKYLNIIEKIRRKIPEAGITADVIVGFPGETEGEFEDTLKLMEEVKFDNVNTAAYSPRPNTPAADWTNQVDDDVKNERLQRINKLNLQHAKERRARMVGRFEKVLVESRNVKNPKQVFGRTGGGYVVYFEGEIGELEGKIVDVKITASSTYSLTGELC